MKKWILFTIILFLAIYSIIAENDKQVFMVYGDDFMVNVPLPNYWEVDMDFAYQNGINGFFYIKDYGIQKSPVGIILTLAEKPNDLTELQEYIDYDRNQLLNYYKDNNFNEITLNNERTQKYGYKVMLYEFKNKSSLIHYQNIAYIDCNAKYFIKLYIDCKDKKGSEKYIEDYIESIFGLNYMNIKLNQ